MPMFYVILKSMKKNSIIKIGFWFLGFCLFVCFLLLGAVKAAYGNFQAMGRIGAVAAGLYHSHSNSRSKPHLQPTPQLTAILGP